MTKRLLAVITSAALLFGLSTAAFGQAGPSCTGSVDTNDATYKADLDGIEKLHIIVDGSGKDRGGSGVSVIFCDDHDDLLLEYKKSDHSFSVEQEGDTATIRLSGKISSLEDVIRRGMSRMVLHLPRKAYGQVKVESIQAGVSVDGINTDLVISNKQGAISVSLPESFSKTLDLSCKQGAASLSLRPGATDYTLRADVTGSAVSMPEGLPAFRYGAPYEYVSGTGKAAINLKLQSCAMSVNTAKD